MPLPDFSDFYRYLTPPEGGPLRFRIVEVNRIVGMNAASEEWTTQWTLDRRVVRNPGRREWHETKLRRLLGCEGNRPKVTSDLYLADGWFTRQIDLREIEELFFVTNGIHRVAIAYQLGIERIRANVRSFRLAPGTPRIVRERLRSLRTK
jgi:hypothetical protein